MEAPASSRATPIPIRRKRQLSAGSRIRTRLGGEPVRRNPTAGEAASLRSGATGFASEPETLEASSGRLVGSDRVFDGDIVRTLSITNHLSADAGGPRASTMLETTRRTEYS